MTSLSFLGASCLVVFTDPYDNSAYMWVFLALLFMFLVGCFSLLVFWWFFAYKKQILSVPHVNLIVYNSAVTATVVITCIVLNQTQQFNSVTAGIVIAVYVLYWLWFASREDRD